MHAGHRLRERDLWRVVAECTARLPVANAIVARGLLAAADADVLQADARGHDRLHAFEQDAEWPLKDEPASDEKAEGPLDHLMVTAVHPVEPS